MRTFLTTALLLPMLLLSACQANTCTQECPTVTNNTRVLRHIVIFKFKDSASEQEIQSVVDAFADLENKIDTIVGFEFGRNVSNEGLDQGFTHCFTLSFADQAGLDAYLPHPAHVAFVEQLKTVMDAAFVVDYWTN